MRSVSEEARKSRLFTVSSSFGWLCTRARERTRHFAHHWGCCVFNQAKINLFLAFGLLAACHCYDSIACSHFQSAMFFVALLSATATPLS